jgi:predicted nuclease with TOPRIM domain
MVREQDLAKLEDIVENLLLRFNVLKQDNSELKAQVKLKDEKINELQIQVDSLTVNKSEVHGRVSSLIDTIEDWEKTFSAELQEVSDAVEDSRIEKVGIDPAHESQLFSVGE